MNKEEPLRDQAERLRKRISKKSEPIEQITAVSDLPPRSRVHQQEQKRKKKRLKLKYPIIRLLALFFILLPIVSFSIYTINQNKEKAGTEPVENNERENIESVNVADDDEGVSISESTDMEEKTEEVDEEVVAETEAEANQETEIVESEDSENQASTQTTINDKNTTTPVTETEPNTDKGTIQSHTVQPGETLYRIAMKYYGSQSGIEKIKQANNIQGNEIQVGQTIKIPNE